MSLLLSWVEQSGGQLRAGPGGEPDERGGRGSDEQLYAQCAEPVWERGSGSGDERERARDMYTGKSETDTRSPRRAQRCDGVWT